MVLDFELANASHSSVCSIGVVRVSDGIISAPKHWFVRPPHPYDFMSERNMEITGISPEDLADARGFDFHGPNLVRNLDGGILVGHGIRSADIPMFTQSWFAWPGLGVLPGFRYVDTVLMAKELLPEIPKHRLNLVVEHLFGEEFSDHHRADADAEATARILLEMLSRSGTALDDWVRTMPPKAGCALRPPAHRDSGRPIPAAAECAVAAAS